jgi:hypothetical protein
MGSVHAGTGTRTTPYVGGRLRPPLTWLEAWSIARQELKLSATEWLDMTPRMLHALRLRQIETMQREELLVGIIASTTANYGFCRPDKPLSPSVFMLHPFAEEEPAELTGEDVMAAFAPFVNRQSTEVSA